ncbi:MAG: T9SS type A sorting domain-containing protein [Saprospiraceae bacterium]|nr:T9SS type A sorting domain-containing protein [Saprospiraceae bacterium]
MMMKYAYLTFVFAFSLLPAYGQYQPDARWPLGAVEFPGAPYSGNAWVRFENDSVVVEPVDLNMNFEATVAVASDTAGNILFYSNGCNIYNVDKELMTNGDGLNPGTMSDQFCPFFGYPVPSGAVALPHPDHPTRWIVLHLGAGYDPVRKITYGPLYFSEIDMAGDDGKGSVINKNNLLVDGDVESFAMTRHGNGRDWWVVTPEFNSNKYFIHLLSPTGVSFIGIQTIGDPMGCRRMGASTFSPDGSRYARAGSCHLVVMDFDRCSGTFNNPLGTGVPPYTLAGGGAAFSPDSRWLYTTAQLGIYRINLEDTPLELDSVFRRPFYFDEYPRLYNVSLANMQYAPDGKLYVGFVHREKFLNKISFPTANGDSIYYESEGLPLPVNNVRTLPYFPNFRLYDQAESFCDTLGIDTPVNATVVPLETWKLLVFPNPVQNGKLFFDCSNTTQAGPANIQLYDLYGQVIHSRAVMLLEGVNELEVAGLPNGVYVLEVTGQGFRKMAKVVVQE